ncbi:MAG: c-type cytochrome, partial [Elusimicrobia bacterium]|nr:c-type cytochrome [Elusimicrobiota bacterium]
VARADGYKDVARELSKAARAASVKKAAVLPFIFINRPLSAGPVIVSERLTSRMSGKAGLELVERQLLGKLLSEKRLSLTGALDAAQSSRIGQILNLEAVICGTLVDIGDERIEVNARLIRAQDGKILGTARSQVKQDWKEPALGSMTPRRTGEATQAIDLAMISVPEMLYRAKCASCHGLDGSGADASLKPADVSPSAMDLTSRRVQSRGDLELELQIEHGGRRMPPHGDLPGVTQSLSAEEVSSLARLIRQLGRERTAKDGARRAGAKLFEQHCAACHGFDGRGSHLAAGLFDADPKALDLASPKVAALGEEQLIAALKKKKRKMMLQPSLEPERLTQLWLYLQHLARDPL